jgi:predicted aspartyl protease
VFHYNLAAALMLCFLAAAAGVNAQSDFPRESAVQTAAIQLHSAPDENSLSAGSISPGEATTPIAESHGANGVKWFLVRTKAGTVGWIKQSQNAESRKLDGFFKSLAAEPSSFASVNIPSASSASAPRGAVIVPVIMTGQSIIVPVTLNNSVRTNLLLDTGATTTLLSQRLASSLSLNQTGSSRAAGVGGIVSVGVARLDSLRVGEAEVSNLAIMVHDFARDPRHEGLLGMDFLRAFQVSIDAKKQVLVLTPR